MKKIILVLLATALVFAPNVVVLHARAAITLVVKTALASPNNNNVTTSNIDTTNATLLLVGCTCFPNSCGSGPSDSKSNTWANL